MFLKTRDNFIIETGDRDLIKSPIPYNMRDLIYSKIYLPVRRDPEHKLKKALSDYIYNCCYDLIISPVQDKSYSSVGFVKETYIKCIINVYQTWLNKHDEGIHIEWILEKLE